jgi:hypothetical protein
MKMKALKSKFKIGDIVAYSDDFGFNPANDVITIGRVESIHFFRGHEIGYRPSRGEKKPKSLNGIISYRISGLNIEPLETELETWETEE